MVNQTIVLMDDIGVTADEAIPGLVASIATLANDTSDPRLALTEAIEMLEEVTPL